MLDRFSDIACMTDNSTLTELSLDGNPLTNNPHYRKMIIHRMKHLKVLDTRPLTVCIWTELSCINISLLGRGEGTGCSSDPRGSTRITKS